MKLKAKYIYIYIYAIILLYISAQVAASQEGLSTISE
jgi:hypothetical protein